MPSYSNIVSAPLAAANVAGATTVITSIDDLPLTGNTIGDLIYVSSAGRLFIWSNGWYNIALVNSSPTITTNLDPFIAFEQDGTPLVLTLQASDPEGIPLIWSYSITSGSLGNTATITQVDNVFTITPSDNPANAGEFEITFTASDGVAISTLPSTFRLSFYTNWNHGYNHIGVVEDLTLPTSSFFGQGISTDGIHFIVGASGATTNTGRAYVVEAATATILRELICPAPGSNTYFGISTAVSGNYCAVGQPGNTATANGGRVYVYEVNTGNLLYTLENPNVYGTTNGDLFGKSFAISGTTLAVVAEEEDAAGGTGSGAIYVFDITDGTLLYTLENPNIYGTQASDYFGAYSTCMSGNYLVTSAIAEDNASVGSSVGVVYVFNATTGQLLYSLYAPVGYQALNAFFGRNIAIDSNTDRMVIGNSYGTKFIHVYELSTGTLLRTHGKPAVVATSNSFGYSLALDGYTIAIVDQANTSTNALWLAHTEKDSDTSSYDAIINLFDTSPANTSDPYLSGVNVSYVVMKNGILGVSQTGYSSSRGRVYIHKDVGILPNTIIQNANAYNTPASDAFGISVAASGNYAIIGARDEDDAGGTSSGKAYIYDIPSKTLLHTLDNPNAYGTSGSDYFGWSVAISGNYAIVSAYQEDSAGLSNPGKAYIFNVTTGALIHTLDNPGSAATTNNSQFGFSVSISGNYAAVSCHQDNDGATGSGKAYIFNVTTGALVHTINNPNAYDTATSDYFGRDVSIYGDYLVVGTPNEDDATGANSGKVYVFSVQSGELLYTLDNPNVYSTSAADGYGSSVKVSGKYLAVGANEKDPSGTQTTSGVVYVYDVRDGTLLYTFTNPNIFNTYTSDFFGGYLNSTSIDGNFLVVSAYGEDRTTTYTNYGAVYIYNLTNGELIAKIPNPSLSTVASGDTAAGLPVAITGKYLLAGYSNIATSGGMVRVFEANP